MKGININCKHQDFIGQILSGEKTVETRNTPSLNPYIGQRIGLIRTGKGKATLEGYATITGNIVYNSKQYFDYDYRSHRVGNNSPYYINESSIKVGYILGDVEAINPQLVSSRGIVSRDIGNPYLQRA